MSNDQKELSYFALRLQELLNSSFPERATDQKFIQQRSELAGQAYEDAFKSGNPIAECTCLANEVLFEGLHFSKFDTVFQLVSNEFDTLMADEELRPFALKMLPVCEPIFSLYELVDDFAYTFEFDQLYTQLTALIAIWIDEHGLQ